MERQPLKTVIVKEYLKVEFTHDEIHEMGSQLAQTTKTINELENDKKAVNADFKAKIEGQSAVSQSLSTKIQNGFEYRHVECEVRYNDPTTGMKTTVRKDSGEVLRKESMTTDEMQLELEL
jgi:hypothetical protein